MKSVSRLFLVLACIACAIPAFADFARGGFNGWAGDGEAAAAPMSPNAGNTFYTVTKKATATGSGLKFDLNGQWTSTQWGAGTAATVNSSVGSASMGGGDLTFAATKDTYYTFRLAGWYLSNPRVYAIMATDAEPVTFSDASDDHATQYTDAVTVTATLSAAPSTQEKVYLVYTVNNWTNRALVAMQISGSSATGTIPAQTAGTAVEYYVFTSTFTLTTAKLTDNAISTVWSDSGTQTSIPTADFVLLNRYPTDNKSYTVTAKPTVASVAGPTGTTSLKLGTAFDLGYEAVNFASAPTWTCTVTPAIADAAVAPASGNATTFTATPEAAGSYTLKVIATAGGVSVTNTAALTVTAPDFGNCWHQPGEVPTGWGETTMRYPAAPAEGASNLFLVVGSYQPQGDMTTGTVYVSTDDGATWASHGLGFDSGVDGGDKFWACNLDISALEEGDTLQYAIEVKFSDKDTTYLGSTNQTDTAKFASLAMSKAHPYEVEIAAAPLRPGDVYHDDGSYQPWTNEPATHMREMPGPWVDGGLPVSLRMADRTAEATAAFVEYRIGDGAWTELEMAVLPPDGTWAAGYADVNYWTNTLPAGGADQMVKYYFRVLFTNSTKLGTTYLYSSSRTTLDEAEARESAFSFFASDPSFYMCNVWHFPTNYEPWAGAQMREPLAPKEGEAPYLRLGSAGEDGEGYSTWITGAEIKYRVDGGAWQSLAMGWEQKASEEGKDEYRGNAYWTNALPAASEGALVEYYFVTECTNSTLRTTYLYSDGEAGCEKSFAESDAQADPFSYTVAAAPVVEPVFGNCWHQPAEVPTGWGDTTMRYPVAPAEGDANLFLVVGSYAQEGNMTTGTVYVSTDDGATWTGHGLDFNSENGDNKYWACNVDISALEEGDTLQYAIEVKFSDKDTTYLGTTNQLDTAKFETLAEAQAAAYEIAIGAAPVLPIASTVWHIPADKPDGWSDPMRNPLSPAEGDANVAVFIGNYQADAAGANMTTGAVYWRKGSTGDFAQAPVAFDSEMRTALDDGYLKFWVANLDTADFAEGDALEYYCLASVEGFAPTFIGTTNAGVGNALFADEAEAASNAFSVVFGAAPVLESGNVWHYPQNEEPWTGATMLFPDPLLSGVDAYVRAGASPKDGNDSMTAGKVWYRVGDGEWTSVDMYGENLDGSDSPYKDSGNAYWAGIIPGAALEKGTTVQYYIQADFANSTTLGTTYVGTSTGQDNVKFRTAAEARSNAFERVVQVNLGNCWHVPGQFEPWGDATMRNPCYPSAGDAVCIFVGNQAWGDGGTPGDMSGGFLHHRMSGAPTWDDIPLEYEEHPVGNNKYWKAVIPAGTYPSAGDMEYYIEVTYDQSGQLAPPRETTYLGTENGAKSVAYESAAKAEAKPFTCRFGDLPGKEPGYMWHAGNAVLAGTNSVQFWVKIGYTKDGVDWADTVEMRYNVCTGAIPASVAAKGKRLSANSYRTASVRSATEYTNTVSLVRDHEEEDTSEHGNGVWWMCTVTDDGIAVPNTYIQYEIAAKKSAAKGGNDTWCFADYRTASASNTFYYTMWQAGANTLTVNGLNADYTTSKFFIDEAAIAAGTEEAPDITVYYNPDVNIDLQNGGTVELFSNVGRRDFWNADLDGNGIADAIYPADGSLYTAGVTTNGYYLAQTMPPVAGKGYGITIKADKTGAYRLTARYKKNASDGWHYYSELGSGIRDHAVVISPKKVLRQNVYEVNGMTAKAESASQEGHSTFADLIEGEDSFAEFGIPYLNKIQANCLWFQPIHTSSEQGLAVGGEPGSPYAAKDYFSVSKWYGKSGTTEGALNEFTNFVAACDAGRSPSMSTSYVGTINIMLDGVFNHTSWDAVFGVMGETMGLVEEGQGATTAIASVMPGWYANCSDYGAPATWYRAPGWGNHDIACGPDRGDFGKWEDTAELFYGRYSALVCHNPDNNGDYLNEEDTYRYDLMDTNTTVKLWQYMGAYVPYWLEKTGHAFGNEHMGETDANGIALDDYGIDGLRCDFGQGLPPQFWEYCINRARARKWNFMFMAESLDGGKVSYRSNRHFDILNESFVFAARNAGSPRDLVGVLDDKKNAYNGGVILLNLTSHDEVMPYTDPWMTVSRYAMLATVKGLPMTMYGQEQGIIPCPESSWGHGEGDIIHPDDYTKFGFWKFELNFGKWVADFKTWNKLTIWDDPPLGEDASRGMAQLYGRINWARLNSPALQSDKEYLMNLKDGGDSQAIWAMAKANRDEPLKHDDGDAVIGFVKFIRGDWDHGYTSETFKIADGVDAFLGLEDDEKYNVRNLASADASATLWPEPKKGSDLKKDGIEVIFSGASDTTALWSDGAMVQFLKIEKVAGVAPTIAFEGAAEATNGVAASFTVVATDADGVALDSATCNGAAFGGEWNLADGGVFTFTPTNAGSYVFVFTASNAIGSATATNTIAVAKGTPEVVAPTGLTSEVGKTLADVALPTGFAWKDDSVAFTATGTVSAAWTYLPGDPDNWNTVEGSSDVEVGKGTPEFGPVGPLAGTYGTTRTLADVEGLPEGYAWADATTEIAGAGTASYPAVYNPDPANWNDAEGTIEVAIAKGTPEVVAPTGLTATVGQTLSDVALPSGFAWVDDSVAFTATGTFSCAWTYLAGDPANWNAVEGTSDVVVTGEEPVPDLHPRTTSIAVDPAAETVTFAGENYPEDVAGNLWCVEALSGTWARYEGPVTTNADATYTISPDPFPAMGFYCVGTPAVP